MSRFLIWAVAGLFAQPQLRIVVNVPAARLDAYVADSVVRSIPIAVGMPAFPTPRGEFAVSSVEWNPWWIPPASPWAAKERPMPPGPTNPMGRVKLNFQPLYFLHGTPLEQSIGTAASHGCVRLRNEDAIALGRLVQQFGTLGWTTADLDRIAADRVRTRFVKLDVAIPISIRYDLVEVLAGRVSVYRDIYRLSTRSRRDDVVEALAGRGIDTMTVDMTRVRALVRDIGPSGRSVAIDSLLVGPSARRSKPPLASPAVTTAPGACS